MEPLGVKKFYGNTTTSAVRRFRLQKEEHKLPAKSVPRSLQPLATSLLNTEVKRKRSATPRKPRTKVPEEPEILTLSSDDEDKQEKKLDRESQILANGFSNQLNAEAKAVEAAAIEEPDCSEESRKLSAGVEGGGMLQQAIEGSLSPPYAILACRTVRIGTYKAKPLEKVVLSSKGLELKMPLPSGQEVTVHVPICDIFRVLVSYCRTMPVIFLYTVERGGIRVRETLRMTDSRSSYYFDPDSSDETHKRITLLPDKINDDVKLSIRKIFEFNKKLYSVIDNAVANEILVKSSPCEGALRARLGLPACDIQTIMIYPPPPTKGGISINTEDYACLGEDQFLNDVIIDFYLKYLLQSVLSEEDRERTHVFSSFFYKRLTSRPKTKGRRHPIEDDPKLTPAEKRHARVKTWTKNVNLFSKDFIIIPINENCHWFLAIICFPGQDGCFRMSDNSPVTIQKPQPTSVAAVAAAAAAATTHSKLKVKDNVMSIGSTTITPVKVSSSATITLDHNGDDGSDRDEAEGDEEEMEENTSDDEEQGSAVDESSGLKPAEATLETNADNAAQETTGLANTPSVLKKGKAYVRDEIKQPCILIFDSLVGAPRYRVAATLREYLSIEYRVKEGKDGKVKEFTKDTIKGMLPKVPQQTNFTDCGLYLLQYVEMFFKDPIRDYHPPIKQLVNWFPEEVVSRKREEIVHLLHDLMEEQGIDRATLPLPKLVFNYSAQMKAQQQAEDEEARARLAEAEAEAEASNKVEVEAVTGSETGHLTELQAVSTEQYSHVEPMDQEMDCESEEVIAHTAEENVEPKCQEEFQSADDSCENSTTANGETDNDSCKQNVSLGAIHSLVDYSESSNESSSEPCLVKRTQNAADKEDGVDRKKRKAE